MIGKYWVRFLSLARSKLRLCSANHRPSYWSNLPCDWLSTAWAYSKQGTEYGPCIFQSRFLLLKMNLNLLLPLLTVKLMTSLLCMLTLHCVCCSDGGCPRQPVPRGHWGGGGRGGGRAGCCLRPQVWTSAERVSSYNRWLNTLRPRQIGHHCADNILKSIFLNKNCYILMEISLKFFPEVAVTNNSLLVKVMVWHWTGGKSLSDPVNGTPGYHTASPGPSQSAFILIFMERDIVMYQWIYECLLQFKVYLYFSCAQIMLRSISSATVCGYHEAANKVRPRVLQWCYVFLQYGCFHYDSNLVANLFFL